VIMFKSLHHVPQNDLDEALSELRRVLKPGGYAYISEPVFAGAFNEIMRLFHDEELVRQQAFDALIRAVENDVMYLEEEYFFKNIIRLPSFDIYLDNVLGVTHSNHELDAQTIAEVKRRFMKHEGDKGFVFQIPNRVDLLRKAQC
jgi:predicted SAM-dependent methyltransferase